VCAADYRSEVAKDVDDASLSTHEIHEELSFLRLLHPLYTQVFSRPALSVSISARAWSGLRSNSASPMRPCSRKSRVLTKADVPARPVNAIV